MSKEKILNEELKTEIQNTYGALVTRSGHMDPITFSWTLSRLSHLLGKWRRSRLKYNEQAFTQDKEPA